jgi:hypothetical protein
MHEVRSNINSCNLLTFMKLNTFYTLGLYVSHMLIQNYLHIVECRPAARQRFGRYERNNCTETEGRCFIVEV